MRSSGIGKHGKRKRHVLPEPGRYRAAMKVYDFLHEHERDLIDQGLASNIDFEFSDYAVSPYQAALYKMKGPSGHGPFKRTQQDGTIKKELKRWFVRRALKPHASGGCKMRDKGRRHRIGEDLTEEDWLELKEFHVAARFRYRDDVGNERRHPDLSHMLQTLLQQEQTARVQARIARLQELQIKARTKSLNTLTERVAERFPNLRRKTELWKPQRHHRDAQISTKRMDAQLPMVEYNYSGHTAVQKGEVVPPREYHIIKTRSELSATQQMVSNKRWEFKKLFYTADAMHITVNLDGCSVFGKGNLKYQSHSVFYDVRLRHHLAHTFCRATQSA